MAVSGTLGAGRPVHEELRERRRSYANNLLPEKRNPEFTTEITENTEKRQKGFQSNRAATLSGTVS
jgi:hypothetical protein